MSTTRDSAKPRRRRFRTPLLLGLAILGCEVASHPPNLSELCPRVVVEVYTAEENECLLLEDANGLTLFKLSSSESCGGPPCLRLNPGETGYALEKIKPGTPAEWNWYRGSCEAIPVCPES